MIRLAVIVSLLLATPVIAAEIPVADVATFDAAVKRAAAGDVIVLRPGEWKDADLRFRGVGTPEKPITLRGFGVKLTGDTRLRIAGEHLVVEGLLFQDCLPKQGDVISFREDSKRLASHCVLRQCAVVQTIAAKDATERKWVSIYGSQNAVERCHFQGKTSRGTLLVVWLPEKPTSLPKHRIAGNYFGPRPRLGKNGGEIIRIGDSQTSMQAAECSVENNLFERCDGEVEAISNKSCGNIYRGNVFLACQGTLTLRHGNGCLVEKNLFIGDGVKGSGGIRIIGEDHRVVGNRLHGLTGDGARAAICLMNGIENSPANGYFQVRRAVVKDNVVVDCKQSIVIGFADEDVKALLPPVECLFDSNVVHAGKRTVVELLDAKADVTWKDNRLWGGTLGIASVVGIAWVEMPPPATPEVGDRKVYGCDWLASAPVSDR